MGNAIVYDFVFVDFNSISFGRKNEKKKKRVFMKDARTHSWHTVKKATGHFTTGRASFSMTLI